MIRTFICLLLFWLLAMFMAYVNLRQARKLNAQSEWAWGRHHLTVCNIWSAVATVISAVIIGVLK